MDKKTNISVGTLLIIVIALLFYISIQSNKKSTLEWRLEIYKERLLNYEDSSVIEHILDSLNKEFSESEKYEERTNSYQHR